MPPGVTMTVSRFVWAHAGHHSAWIGRNKVLIKVRTVEFELFRTLLCIQYFLALLRPTQGIIPPGQGQTCGVFEDNAHRATSRDKLLVLSCTVDAPKDNEELTALV